MKYKNISGHDLGIVGVGVVKADQEVDMPKDFNNANFILVTKETKEEKENVEKKLKDNNK